MTITSVDDAKPCDEQIEKPCHDCPFRRNAIRGWLGGYTVDRYLQLAHSETVIDCHALQGPQCAGAAIYRANVSKKPRSKEILVLPQDKETVFATPTEFKEHHTRPPIQKEW